MNLHKRNKYERIQYVRSLGFNTEENILIKPFDNLENYNIFTKDLNKISLRTFNLNDSLGTPHYPILTKKKGLETILELQKKQIYSIVSTPIDPKDCKFCGVIMKMNENIYVDIANGPGTVRRITHEGKIDESYVLDRFHRFTKNQQLNYCIDECRKCYLQETAFEFSWYNIPIGYKKENFIVWEVTDNGNKKSNI